MQIYNALQRSLNRFLAMLFEFVVLLPKFNINDKIEERLRRNKTENRLKYKQSKRDIEWSERELLKSMEKHKFNSDEGQGEKIFENFMKINNTNISPKDVAKMIKAKFNL